MGIYAIMKILTLFSLFNTCLHGHAGLGFKIKTKKVEFAISVHVVFMASRDSLLARTSKASSS